MIYQETFDYLFGQLAGYGMDRGLRDYQRKRLRRAQLALSIRPFFLQASWVNPTGAEGEQTVANTQAITKPLMVLGGAIRFAAADGVVEDGNNFEIWLRRTAGDTRVQLSRSYIKDEHLLTPAQAAIKEMPAPGGGQTAARGQGAPWPFNWPVPMKLRPNELIQIQARVLTGGVAAGRVTVVQLKCAHVDNSSQADMVLIEDLERYIRLNPVQRPVYLSMFTPNFRSVAFPALGTDQKTTGQTREAADHLLVLGYSMLNARSQLRGTTCSPQWRLTTSDGYSLSKEEIDCNAFAYASPGGFYQAFPYPLLLPRGSSMAASFSTLNEILTAQEQMQNYVFFRCVTV